MRFYANDYVMSKIALKVTTWKPSANKGAAVYAYIDLERNLLHQIYKDSMNGIKLLLGKHWQLPSHICAFDSKKQTQT